MSETAAIETADNPYHRPGRLRWLLGEYEKHLQRFEASRRSMDQKAIWALATATGFVGFLGLVKGEAIGMAIYARFSNQTVEIAASQKFMILIALSFALTYIVLLVKVIKIYFPKKVIDPFMPINYTDETIDETPISAFDDLEENRRIGDQYWYFAMDNYIKPTEIDHLQDILREYSDVFMEQYIKNQEIGKELRLAFLLLPPMAIMTMLLFVLA